MKTLVLASVVTLAAGVALAGPGMGPGMRTGMGPAGHHGMMGGPGLDHGLFRPEFVLENRSALALTDDQVNAITNEIGAAHDTTKGVEEGIRPLADQLHALLGKPQVDEAAALGLAAQIMDLEHQIKTAHLRLMIRVKNLLTPEQQATLKSLRPERPMGPPPPPAEEN